MQHCANNVKRKCPKRQIITVVAQRWHSLKGLVQHLSLQQVRNVRAFVEDVDFSCDVVAKLPLEIRLLIFQYLPLYQYFQARRVSQRWSELLGPKVASDCLLRTWYHGDSSISRLSDSSSDYNPSVLAEHVDAYRRGYPFSMMVQSYIEAPLPPRPYPAEVLYADGVLVWTDVEDRAKIRCIYLINGVQSVLVSPNREAIIKIAVSASMIAATTRAGKAYVWELPITQKSSPKTIQLPSNRAYKPVASAKTLVILHRILDGHRGGFVLTIFTLETFRCDQLVVPLHSKDPIENEILLTRDGKSILLFEDGPVFGPGVGHVYFTRLNLKGEILASGGVGYPDTFYYDLQTLRTQTLAAESCSTIWACLKRQNEYNIDTVFVSWKLVRVIYDISQDQLVIKTQIIDGLDAGEQDVSGLFIWKDVAYCRGHSNDGFGVCVLDLTNSTCQLAEFHTEHINPWPFHCDQESVEEHSYGLNSMVSTFQGDETFLIDFRYAGAIIWCFDKDIQMANEDDEFRRLRNDRMKSRVQRLRDR